MSEKLKVGDFYKVALPGETPWAECMAVFVDGSWAGRIDNKLIGSGSDEDRLAVAQQFFPGAKEPLEKLHDYRENELVRFSWQEITDGHFGWKPATWQMGLA